MKFRSAIVAVPVLLFTAVSAFAQPQEQAKPDWITATNQPCKIWNPAPQPNETVTWSGGCKDGLADGEGILKWFENGKADVEYRGRYANGKRNGHGMIILPNGMVIEGEWLNDTQLVPNRDAI